MTVTATVNYTKTTFELNQVSGLYSAVQVSYPLLIDCPIIVIGGGTAHATFPITKGDECLLLFNDRDIDNWYSTGQVGPLASSRLHGFADAFALVGVKSTPNLLTGYDTVRAIFTDGVIKVGINPSNHKATITNGTYTLNGVLQNILTQLQNLANACALITVSGVTTGAGVSAVPVNAATLSAVATQLATYATQLGSFIE